MDAHDTYLESLVHRRVSYRYRRTDFAFDLSTALFSSAGVDTGTRALLRTLEDPVASLRPRTVLDIGSGSGPLGIALARTSDAALTATDRDALAVWFTDRNARLNGIDRADVRSALGVHDPLGAGLVAPADLGVSNLPAKAGAPVIEHLVKILCEHVCEDGLCGVVIVAPLGTLLDTVLHSLSARIVARRETSSHLCVAFTPGAGDTQPAAHPDEAARGTVPAVYVRGTHEFVGPHGAYRLSTAHNLPEFDSLSYGTALAFRILGRSTPGGRLFFWGVGQGHLAVGPLHPSTHATIWVADRDLLALATTVANVAANRAGAEVRSLVSPGLWSAAAQREAASADWLVVQSGPEPASLWAQEIARAAEHLLARDGRLLVVSRSTSIARLGPLLRSSFSPLESQRHRGYRADLFRRTR